MGLERARARGKRLGRPPVDMYLDRLLRLCRQGLSQRELARRMKVTRSAVRRALARVGQNPLCLGACKPGDSNGRNGQG